MLLIVPHQVVRYFNFGVEKIIGKVFALRLGLFQNISEGAETIYTAGAGLNIKGFDIDYSVVFGDESVEKNMSLGVRISF